MVGADLPCKARESPPEDRLTGEHGQPETAPTDDALWAINLGHRLTQRRLWPGGVLLKLLDVVQVDVVVLVESKCSVHSGEGLT